VVRDGAGRRQGLILVFHDLTRVKELENQRKDFVANVSHELRTPLSLIQGYVETLLDGAKDDPAVAARFLGTIERNTARLRRLIEDLLIVSELESGCVKLNVQPVALSAVVAKVFEDFRPTAAAAGVELRAAVPEVALKADAGRLEQVLTNLVDNAIKYGREGGLVIVEARPAPDGFLEICVRDRGPGIAAADLPRLFERFYRVDRARSRDQGGTGLGLSIVKHIVQCHGGRVRAESRLGEGSAFYFTLPVEAGHPEQAEASGQPAVAGSAPLP
jgi:two-component system phosphate regulon sensor histidine kinase PhoR